MSCSSMSGPLGPTQAGVGEQPRAGSATTAWLIRPLAGRWLVKHPRLEIAVLADTLNDAVKVAVHPPYVKETT